MPAVHSTVHSVVYVEGAALPEDDIQYIIDNMRLIERHEQEQLNVPHNTYELEVARLSDFVAVAYYRGVPAFVSGALRVSPGVYSIWGYGTDHTSKVIKEITDIINGYGREYLMEKRDAQRLQIVLPYDEVCMPNIRWLLLCGFKCEGFARCAAKSKRDAILLSYTFKDHQEYVSRKTFQSSESGSGSAGRTGPNEV